MTGGGLDWSGMVALGLGQLRLRPEEFWALTPFELSLMSGAITGERGMTRAGLETLMATYPDKGQQR